MKVRLKKKVKKEKEENQHGHKKQAENERKRKRECSHGHASHLILGQLREHTWNAALESYNVQLASCYIVQSYMMLYNQHCAVATIGLYNVRPRLHTRVRCAGSSLIKAFSATFVIKPNFTPV